MPVKTVLLTGGNGFIGKNLKESFLAQKYNLLTPGSKDLNLCDEDAVARYFDEHQIDIVIHSAVKPNHRNAKDLSNIFYSNTRMFLIWNGILTGIRKCSYSGRVLFMIYGTTVRL